MQFDFKNIDKINAIVFDLGGVIANIDYYLTVEAFKKLGVTDFDKQYGQFAQSDVFDKMEKGLISPSEFRNTVRTLTGVDMDDATFDKAWFAMLLDTPKERVDLIAKLKKKFKVYLLSNTNEIHIELYKKKVCAETSIDDFDKLFDVAYYSHTTHMKKPDNEIFLKVLNDNNLKADETLFIDDTYLNTVAASKLGIQVYLLNDGKTIVDLFRNI